MLSCTDGRRKWRAYVIFLIPDAEYDKQDNEHWALCIHSGKFITIAYRRMYTPLGSQFIFTRAFECVLFAIQLRGLFLGWLNGRLWPWMLVAVRTAKTAMPCVFVIIISDQVGNLDQSRTIICWKICNCVISWDSAIGKRYMSYPVN